MNENLKESYKVRSRHFIEIVGSKKIQEACNVIPQQINYWKNAGIPKPWFLFLKDRFPVEWVLAFKEEKESVNA
ncbi:MAG: hypothetical protein ACI4M9_03920 [Succinivibrio sp.]